MQPVRTVNPRRQSELDIVKAALGPSPCLQKMRLDGGCGDSIYGAEDTLSLCASGKRQGSHAEKERQRC